MYAQHNFENGVSASVNIRSANSEMDIQKIKKMFYSWEKDYNNAGDSGFAEQDIKTLESLAQRGYLFVLEVDNTDAGFALLKENKKVIDVVYLRPQYRRNGFANRIYQYLILEHGAEEIELTYHRVLNNLEYWKDLGFKCLRALTSQTFNKRALCRLSTRNKEAFFNSTFLNKHDIARYRSFASNKLNECHKPKKCHKYFLNI
jgi:GNAT superfamily N-acetyltransferase